MTRAPALVGALLASLAAAGCHHRTALFYESRHPTGPTCLVSKGCPPAKPIAACPADIAPMALDALLAHRELVCAIVAVRGPLGRGNGTCTLLGCYSSDPRGACCNRCGEALMLGTDAALRDRDYARRRASTLMLSGEHVNCGGDESLICCPVDVRGQEVVARGLLRLSGETLVLEGATLCTPQAAAL